MTRPTGDDLLAVVEATWPPAEKQTVGPWTIRDGRGGGKRVSAATAEGPVDAADVAAAETAMAALGQPSLVMIRPGEDALDALLAGCGYEVIDPVDLYVAPVDALTHVVPPRLSAIEVWPPLAIQREVWAEGGIGPGRIAVMDRAGPPKTSLLGRHRERAVASAFVASHDGIAMVHALEVLPAFRRQGIARNMMHGAAHWAARNGSRHLSLVVLSANAGAQALYSGLGFSRVGRYHYRIRPS